MTGFDRLLETFAAAVALAAVALAGSLAALALVLALLAALIELAAPARGAELVASYYWHGVRTASGERFDPLGLTAAHRTLPFGTRLRVTWRGRAVIVRINDRGPFVAGRDLDLSLGAARALGLTRAGVARVGVERLEARP